MMFKCSRRQSLLIIPRCSAMIFRVAACFAFLAFGVVVNANKIEPEDLPLKTYNTESGVPVKLITLSGTAGNLIEDVDGNRYDLAALEPYVELFVGEYYVSINNGKAVRDIRSGDVTVVPIFKGTYEDGSIVLVEKDGDDIQYIELRKPQGEPDMFMVPNFSQQGTGGNFDDDEGMEFLAYTEEDIDYDLLREHFHYGEASIPGDDDDEDYSTRRLRSKGKKEVPQDVLDAVIPDSDYRAGREYVTSQSLKRCSSYRVVKLAIVFDAEFCSIYGSFEAARRRIMTIVASASFHYERDLCVQLRITDIYTPETRCSINIKPSFFANFDRDFPCGGDANSSFLSLFRAWMRRNRRSLRFNSDAAVHIFSGFPPPGGTIGCAWVGAFCSSYSYALEYMGFTANPFSQGVVLAHEMGHNLNAPHLTASSSYRHVMEPNINNAADGFSQSSEDSILSFLNSASITCDVTANSIPTRSPSRPPTVSPTRRPTPRPVVAPTPPPTRRPTRRPTRPPTPAPDDSNCILYQDTSLEPVCLEASNDDKYVCYEASSLLNARATNACMFPMPRTNILRCDGRLTRGQFPNGSQMPLDVFSTRSCSASNCVVVSNYICLRAVNNRNKVYSITYAAVADADVFEVFETEVMVKADSSCDTAETACTNL